MMFEHLTEAVGQTGLEETDETGEDNSSGRGYYPLPDKLQRLQSVVHGLRKADLLRHVAYPDQGTHMLEFKQGSRLVLPGSHLKKLLDLGLDEISGIEKGKIAFYFTGYPMKRE